MFSYYGKNFNTCQSYEFKQQNVVRKPILPYFCTVSWLIIIIGKPLRFLVSLRRTICWNKKDIAISMATLNLVWLPGVIAMVTWCGYHGNLARLPW
jgi:hypothetical protein